MRARYIGSLWGVPSGVGLIFEREWGLCDIMLPLKWIDLIKGIQIPAF